MVLKKGILPVLQNNSLVASTSLKKRQSNQATVVTCLMMIKLPRSLALVAILVAVNVFTSDAKTAVVEFYPDQVSFPSIRIQNNLNGLRNTLDAINWPLVDILVFPEYAILGEGFYTRESIAPYLENIPYIKSTDGYIKPCHDSRFNDRPILQQLSCIADSYDVKLVANMGDIQPCKAEPCPHDGKFYYNTNVVFDRGGYLLAKYHKVNLYPRERKLFNPGTNPNTTCVSVYTDEYFGTFTCHDLLFKEPANCLFTQYLSYFVLTGSCGNQFPFLISTAIAQSWSQKHNVGLVVANQHFPTLYGTGSGVYSGGIPIRYMMSGEEWTIGTGKVIIGDDSNIIPVSHEGDISDVDNIKAQASTHLNYTLLQNKQGTIGIEYKDNTSLNLSLRCNLEYTIQSSYTPYEVQYALGAYIGASKSDDNFYYAVCTLVKCPLSGHCGEPVEGYKTDTIFGKVVLNGTFAQGSDVYATALGNELQLVDRENMDIGTNNVTIKETGQPLLAVSLWSRVDVG